MLPYFYTMIHNRQDRRFVYIVLLVHVVFFLLALHYTRIYNGDSFEYIYEALSIKDHFFFYSGNPAMPVVPEYMSFRTPGYPLFLMLVYFFSINNWMVLVLQNILSVINILYFRKLITEIGYDKKYDWLFLVLLISYPAQFIHANIIEPEILLQGFVVMYLCYFIRFVKDKKVNSVWMMSLALVLALFTKPVLYPYVAIHFVLLALFYFGAKLPVIKTKISWWAATVFPLVFVLVYCSWNQERTGKFHFTSNQSLNAIYYFYYYKANTEGLVKARQFLEEERRTIRSKPSFEERYDYANARGTQLFKENLSSYLPYHLKYSLKFFIDPGKGDIDLFTGRLTYGNLHDSTGTGLSATVKEKGWLRGIPEYTRQHPDVFLVWLVLLFNIIKIIGLLLFVFNNSITPLVRLFCILFLLYFALLTGPITTPRYVVPVSLVYIGCATLGYQYFLTRWRRQASLKPVV